MAFALALAGLGFLALGTLPEGAPRPDPFLLMLVPLALRHGSRWAGGFGFVAGLALGALSPGPVGAYAAVYGGTGWLLGLAGPDSAQGPVLSVLLTGAGTVAVGLGLAGLGNWLGTGPDLARMRMWLPGAMLANLLLLGPALAAVRALGGPRGRW